MMLKACFAGHRPDVHAYAVGDEHSGEINRFLVACPDCGVVTKQWPSRRDAAVEWNDDHAQFWNRGVNPQPPMTFRRRLRRWLFARIA